MTHFFDMLDPGRNWPPAIERELEKRILMGLRLQDNPPPRLGNAPTPRMSGDLLLSTESRAFMAQRRTKLRVPRWERDDDSEGRARGDAGEAPIDV